MSEILDNSVWPNGLKKDDEGYTTYYRMGTNKLDISTITWPTGDKLVSPYVYQNGRLVGFCDTKALTVSGNTTVNLPYTHIEANFAAISEGTLTVNAPNATVKKFKWSVVSGEGGSGGVEVNFKYKGCKTVDDIREVDLYYRDNGVIDGVWVERLDDLENGDHAFVGYGVVKEIVSFNVDLPNLISGQNMFEGNDFTTFASQMPKLTNGHAMFAMCENLISFTSDLPSLTNGDSMFENCFSLTSFKSDLTNLTDGRGMFMQCNSLSSFEAELPNLVEGFGMFSGCKLNLESVERIASSLQYLSNEGTIWIDIEGTTPTTQHEAAFNEIMNKNWVLYVNGEGQGSAAPPPISLIDEENNTATPIPFYAKPQEVTEDKADYVGTDGKFYRILGAQFIYGDDLSTYGMFSSLEDAAANMRLTKIEKRNQ